MKQRLFYILLVGSAVFSLAATLHAQESLIFHNTLSLGASDAVTGGEVTKWQTYLIAQKYLTISAPTGYFGVLTGIATEAWQAAQGITQTYPALGVKSRAILAQKSSAVAVAVLPPRAAVLPSLVDPPAILPPPTPTPTCRTRKVPEDYRTITLAIAAACENDIVQLSAGTFREVIVPTEKAIIVRGMGQDKTRIMPTQGPAVFIGSISPLVSIEAMTLQGSDAYAAAEVALPSGKDFLVRFVDVAAVDSEEGFILGGDGTVEITRSLIARNHRVGIIDKLNGAFRGSYLTIVKSDAGYSLQSMNGTHAFTSSIIAINKTDGMVMQGKFKAGLLSTDYTDVWGSINNFFAYGDGVRFTPAGTGNLSTNPLFAGEADYRLSSASPLVSMGDPAKKDADGSRSDMGAFPFDAVAATPQNTPFSFLSLFARLLIFW